MAGNFVSHVWAQLDAAGVTAAFPCGSCLDHTFQIVIAAIDTTVVVRAEGSNDGTSWFNMDDNGADTTYTANGTYILHKGDFTCYQVRFRFVSETGGAAVTVDVTYNGRGRGWVSEQP